MPLILFVALGGALGAAARYGVAGWVHGWTPSSFPWGTLAVNATGSFLLGFFMRYFTLVVAAPELRAGITVGFLGAFTTFSTYSYETVTLIQEGAWARAAGYALGSLGAGLAFISVGIVVGRIVAHR